MARPLLSRRKALVGAISLAAMRSPTAMGQPPGRNDAMDRLSHAAERGELLWYDGRRRDQLVRVIAGFNAAYPGMRVRGESIPAEAGIIGRLQLEFQASTPMADLVSLGGGGIARLLDRGLVRDVDWSECPIEPALIFHRHAVMFGAATICIAYNTETVPVQELPRRWEDLLDSRWSNRIGSLAHAEAFAKLAAIWGEERATAFCRRFLALRPMLFRNPASLFEQVATGHVHLGLCAHHNALAAMRRGASIGTLMLDPTPCSAIFAAVVRNARRPNAATLFGAWLAASSSAPAFERATDRGNPLIPGTRIAQLLEGRQLADWPIDRSADYARLLAHYNGLANAAQSR